MPSKKQPKQTKHTGIVGREQVIPTWGTDFELKLMMRMLLNYTPLNELLFNPRLNHERLLCLHMYTACIKRGVEPHPALTAFMSNRLDSFLCDWHKGKGPASMDKTFLLTGEAKRKEDILQGIYFALDEYRRKQKEVTGTYPPRSMCSKCGMHGWRDWLIENSTLGEDSLNKYLGELKLSTRKHTCPKANSRSDKSSK